MNNHVEFAATGIVWRQISQNRHGRLKGERLHLLSGGEATEAAVFADFVATSGGDIRTSVLAAIDDLRREAGKMIPQILEARSEEEILGNGLKTKKLVDLYKALEEYENAHYGQQDVRSEPDEGSRRLAG